MKQLNTLVTALLAAAVVAGCGGSDEIFGTAGGGGSPGLDFPK